MKLEIIGNPGTGNHYTEVNIKNIEANFPNVTEVIITKDANGKKTITTNGGENPAPSDGTLPAPTPETGGNINKEARRQDILHYVEKTLPLVLYDWKANYMDLWADILNIPEVDAMIYKRGHQQRTSFNRKEVLHIICYLGKHANGGIGIFEERYVAKHIAELLNDGCEKSTRPELSYNTTKPIQEAIDKLMKSKKYARKQQKPQAEKL